MTHEPGFYIVKNKGSLIDKSEHFLWIVRKKNGLYYQLDNGLPQKLEGECQYDLENLVFVKKLRKGRSSLRFKNVKIDVEAECEGSRFGFRVRDIIGLKRLAELFPNLFG